MTTRDVIERYRQQNDDIGVQISMGGSIPPRTNSTSGGFLTDF